MVNLFSWFANSPLTKGLAAILLSFALISCGDTDGDPEDLTGVAATGAATEGTVFVMDAEGTELSTKINADGFFRFDLRGMTAPFMLKSVASNGIDPDLYSYAEEANVEANITPLTNLVMFMANGNADPVILYDSWVSSFVNVVVADVINAQAVVNANLSTQYTAFSIDPLTYDFFASRFFTNGTSFDGLLDAMTVDLSAGISISIASIADALVFAPDIDITGFDIGADSIEVVGAYSLSVEFTVDGTTFSSLLLSVGLPESSVPTLTGNTQFVEDTFRTFYGTVGDIVINSVTVTIGEDLETIAEVDATITSVDDGAVSYIGVYTYTLNVE